jgi:phosphatidylserine decarboxylase
MNLLLTIIPLILIIIYLWWRFYYFFRDPERTAPEGDNIVSPADGKIVYIRKVKKGKIPLSIKKGKEIELSEITKINDLNDEEKYIIGIFMFPWSVHVNRAPIEGVVSKTEYFKSKNLPMTLMFMKSLFNVKPFYKNCKHVLENERNTVVINGKFQVMVVQIADIYVNKILCSVKPDQKVKKGQRIGMIKMGSQVDCIFPASNANIKVKEGQHVEAGTTILSSY